MQYVIPLICDGSDCKGAARPCKHQIYKGAAHATIKSNLTPVVTPVVNAIISLARGWMNRVDSIIGLAHTACGNARQWTEKKAKFRLASDRSIHPSIG